MHRAAALVGIALLSFPVVASAQSADRDARIVALLGTIADDRLAATVAKLQSFETRHTLSAQDASRRGIGAAAEWISDELRRASPRLQVTFDEYEIPAQGARIVRDVRIRNVVATLPGRSARSIYITAHYDSLARVPDRGVAQPGPSQNQAPRREPGGSDPRCEGRGAECEGESRNQAPRREPVVLGPAVAERTRRRPRRAASTGRRAITSSPARTTMEAGPRW